jgi:hypothetical protein
VHQSEPVTDYLAVVARELGFDPALSRRVRGEVEDHLWQAADDRGGRSAENQLQAISCFGEARDVVRGYVAASLLSQVRRVNVGMLIAAAVIFLAMKARVVWYGLMFWEPNPDFTAVTSIALPIDRYATMLAIAAALIACAYIATRSVPTHVDMSYRKQLNRCTALCGTSAAALSLCVATEALLTGVRLSGTQWCAATAVPMFSLAVEIAAIAWFVFSIHASVRRRALAATLLRD